MNNKLVLNVVVNKNNNKISGKIELPYIIAKKEMMFATLITDVSFYPEKYKKISSFTKKTLNDIYVDELDDNACEEILNKYRGMGIMSGEISKSFDEITSLFVKHCISMCQIDDAGNLLEGTITPSVDQAMNQMLQDNSLLNEVYQYSDKKTKIGKINLTIMQPEPIRG